MTKSDHTRPPGLDTAGTKLWNSVTKDFELEPHELSLLLQAARTADASDALQKVVDAEGVVNQSSQGLRAHPALVEARAQRALLGRLLKQLGVPVGVGDVDKPKSTPEVRRRWKPAS